MEGKVGGSSDPSSSQVAADRAGGLAPPPVIVLLVGLIGYALHRAWPLPLVPAGPASGWGYSLFFLGVALVVWAFVTMLGARTTFNVYRSSTAIVTGGPYRWSRNPGYLGLTVSYLGACLLINSLWMLALTPLAVAALHHGVIVREERYLERKFGEDYRDYRRRVRRWL